MRVMKKGMFAGSGTNSASATIAETVGQIIGTRLGYTSPDAGTLVFYRASHKTQANAPVSNTTPIVVKTDAAGYPPGSSSVITTNDLVLIGNSTAGGTVWTLQTISSVAGVSNSTVSLGLGGNVTCKANDPVFIVRLADIVTLVTGTETVNNLMDPFSGLRGMPVHIVLAATGTCRVNGQYNIEE